MDISDSGANRRIAWRSRLESRKWMCSLAPSLSGRQTITSQVDLQTQDVIGSSEPDQNSCSAKGDSATLNK